MNSPHPLSQPITFLDLILPRKIRILLVFGLLLGQVDLSLGASTTGTVSTKPILTEQDKKFLEARDAFREGRPVASLLESLQGHPL